MTLDQVVSSIIERSREVPAKQSMLVGISGIDSSGKGYLTRLLSELLRAKGLNTAVINIDGWLFRTSVSALMIRRETSTATRSVSRAQGSPQVYHNIAKAFMPNRRKAGHTPFFCRQTGCS